MILQKHLLCRIRYGRKGSRAIGGSCEQRWLLLCPPPSKFPRCRKGTGSMGGENHVVNSRGVPVSSDFLTPSFTGLELWEVNQTCG